MTAMAEIQNNVPHKLRHKQETRRTNKEMAVLVGVAVGRHSDRFSSSPVWRKCAAINP